MLEYLKALLFGILEGITEWLPVSSTGHLELLKDFWPLRVSESFWDMFEVVIQLGAVLSVVVLSFSRLLPIKKHEGKLAWDKPTLIMWVKIAISCVPAAVVGLLFDDKINEWFYNSTTISIMLITVGIVFLIVEYFNKNATPKVNSISEISYLTALYIGLFQLVAAVFPGTSRSGATIVGALLLGVSRTVAAEYTFYLAIPVMFGASALKLLKFGFDFTGSELGILLIGFISAFLVSVAAIKWLLRYVKKNDFRVFGYYRIALGALVGLYFLIN